MRVFLQQFATKPVQQKFQPSIYNYHKIARQLKSEIGLDC